MELVIPDGAQVHITVGHPPLLALPHDRSADAHPPGRSTGRLAKGLVAGVLFIGAFQAGRFLPHHAQTASAAPPPAALAGSGAADGNAAGGNAAAEIPPAFRAQMAQPPQVVPPPGAGAPASNMGGSTGSPTAAPAPAAANPFGLHG